MKKNAVIPAIKKIHRYIYFLSLTAIPLFFDPVFAETIVLKSGKAVEGKIIEKTDESVKVDIGGVSIIYYLEDIDNIDGKKVILPSPQEESLSFEKQNSMDWQQWNQSINSYMNKITDIQNESKKIAIQANRSLNEAMRINDAASGEKIIAQTGDKIASFVDALKAIEPPQELSGYHKKIIKSFEDRKMSNDAFLKKDADSSAAYNRSAIISEMESIEELRNICNKHSAPKQALDALDSLIAKYKQYLSSNQ